MRILLLGSGGREHALAWKMKQSPLCSALYIAPGNAGTALCGTNIAISATDFEAQKQFCTENKIDMVVVGPEDPLVKGIADFYKADAALQHIVVIGPSAFGAQLEGSKAFSKKFMERQQIPTASYAEFTIESFEAGKTYLQQHGLPVVLKADGLAAGKGVVIAATHEEALRSFEEMILHKQFGEASSKVVVEQFLDGIEVSVFVLTDGINYKIIGHAKDYKRIGEGDTGLNTGGMGCVSPVPFMDEIFMQKVISRIVEPTINGLKKEKIAYKGFVFFGLINVQGDPFVIEYNCRMGDPETEVVMPRLQNDLVELFLQLHRGTIADTEVHYLPGSFATVVAVSGGYPGSYKKGYPISGLNLETGSVIFHAGTSFSSDNEHVLTNGGRVLAVTSADKNITKAVEKSLLVLRGIHFEGMYYRGDIGYEFE